MSLTNSGSFKVLDAQGAIEVRQSNGDPVYYSTFPVTVSVSSTILSAVVKGDVTRMDCSTLPISQLDAHDHATLQELNVNACALSSLHIYGCANLKQVFCQGNALFSLALTQTKLQHLNAA